jgi:hypothetical protein
VTGGLAPLRTDRSAGRFAPVLAAKPTSSRSYLPHPFFNRPLRQTRRSAPRQASLLDTPDPPMLVSYQAVGLLAFQVKSGRLIAGVQPNG